MGSAVAPSAARVFGRFGGLGIAFALLGASLWGFSGACAQYLMGLGVSAGFVTAVRMFASGLIFLAWGCTRGRERTVAILRDARARRGVVVFGAVGLFSSQITYLIAIGYTNAGTATVLQSTSMVFVMLAACVLARRLPDRLDALGVALATCATWLIATDGDLSALALPPAGLAWGIANGIACAFYIVYPKDLLARWGALPVTGLGMLVGGAVAMVAFFRPADEPLAQIGVGGWAAFASIVVLGTFLAYVLYVKGIAMVGPVKGALLGVAEPVAATVVSWAWLGTAFSVADLAGLALMAAMVAAISAPRRRRMGGEGASAPERR